MRSYAKLSARTALTGNYIDPAASVIIMLLITLSVVFLNQLVLFYFSRFSKLFLLLSVFALLFTLSMLRYSLSAKLLGVCENEKRSKKTTLKRRLSGGMLELCLFFLRFFYLLVFLLPPAVLTVSVYLRVKASDASAASLAVNISGAALLLLMSLVFWGVSVQKFSKAVYYFAGNPSVSVLNAIKMSTASTQGSLMKIFRFKCSFLPWIASGILLLPLMFVLPYYEESFIFYCMYSRK